MSNIHIRKGTTHDVERVHQLLLESAVHHNYPPEAVKTTPEQMRNDAFGERPAFSFFVAETETQDVVGAAIFYYTYSTWQGKTLYLEDIIVSRSQRGKGIGEQLFEVLAQEAVEHSAQRMSWQVAEDNDVGIGFYEKMNAQFDNQWMNCKLTRPQLKALADNAEAVAI
ncbi:GNAT family N-acetyltransferase [Eisenibacter elegans]|uniref:GNAT family N-acetyltransferase n=1 Tax=Eisenibacter elegans TaxID=997 RepID=UPI000411BED3|nr:GNAT family N-acetyltransferase [Eisenibacter elegans]